MITTHEPIPVSQIICNDDLSRERLLGVQDAESAIFNRVRRDGMQVELLPQNEDEEREAKQDENGVEVRGQSRGEVDKLFS